LLHNNVQDLTKFVHRVWLDHGVCPEKFRQ
jgi:hypothetical protein